MHGEDADDEYREQESDEVEDCGEDVDDWEAEDWSEEHDDCGEDCDCEKWAEGCECDLSDGAECCVE